MGTAACDLALEQSLHARSILADARESVLYGSCRTRRDMLVPT